MMRNLYFQTPPLQTYLLTNSHDDICKAAEIIRRGGVVAFGTETVYGLGALSTASYAVSRIFSIKGRPSFNPLISHFPDKESAFKEVSLDIALAPLALKLAEHFWPGPLTLILPKNPQSRICDTVSAALPTLAIRVPKGNSLKKLLTHVNAPVAAPSANISGMISPSTAQHVLYGPYGLNGKIDAILDTGPCSIGVESTILDLTQEKPILLRPGGITKEDIEAVCGYPILLSHGSNNHNPSAPGQLTSHYAPRLPVRLHATEIAENEALLAFGEPLTLPTKNQPLWNLSPRGDLAEAAARLFAGLHMLDKIAQESHRTMPITQIAVQNFPHHGLGLALLDRLQRAAAPRPNVNDTSIK